MYYCKRVHTCTYTCIAIRTLMRYLVDVSICNTSDKGKCNVHTPTRACRLLSHSNNVAMVLYSEYQLVPWYVLEYHGTRVHVYKYNIISKKKKNKVHVYHGIEILILPYSQYYLIN